MNCVEHWKNIFLLKPVVKTFGKKLTQINLKKNQTNKKTTLHKTKF